MSNPVIGLIEWNSDSDAEPVTFLGDTAEQVRAAAARFLWPLASSEGINYIDDEWVEEHPEPDYADAAAVKHWLDELREASTDAWLTIFGAPGSGEYNSYADVRQ